MTTLSTLLFVTRIAGTTLSLMVVELSTTVALGTNTVDQIVSRGATAGTDSRVPDFIGLAGSPAYSIG